jgi:cyclohexyl-isocyanide hydratase
MNRREFSKASAIAALTALLSVDRTAGAATESANNASASTRGVTPTKESAEQRHLEVMERYRHLSDGPKLTIGMLAYPGMFPMDLVGPLTVFEAMMNREIHILWKDLKPVGGEKPEHKSLLPIQPTTTFKDCPEKLDVVFVPGGIPGTLTMMEDKEVLAFLAEKGKNARYVTSVCTGSLILGAAGLLKGYRAGCYWATLGVLKHLGAIPTKGRIVVDRNRITGGGVTAGIDFGLKLVSLMRSPTYAKVVQLYLEYDPAPPYNAGSPEKAPAEVRKFLTEMYAGLNEAAVATAMRAAVAI